MDQEIPAWLRAVLGLFCLGLGGLTAYLYFIAPPDDLLGIWWLILGIPMVLCGVVIAIAPAPQLALSATGYRFTALVLFLVACSALYSGQAKGAWALMAAGTCIALARKKSAKQ